jgi:hypothetical protein
MKTILNIAVVLSLLAIGSTAIAAPPRTHG